VLAAARARPQAVSYASTGNGASTHLAGVQFAIAANLDLLHVPYRGQPGAMASLLAGDTDLFFNQSGAAMGPIRQGQVRPLAVMSPARLAALPDVPTLAEAGIRDFEATAWFGVQAPSRTPRPIIERLGAEIDAVTRDPAYIARIAELGGAPPALTPAGGTSPETFEAFIRSEITKWAEVVKVSGATVD
jgi:tripartite-type tricarboxylate transporter receptor subunit TctC